MNEFVDLLQEFLMGLLVLVLPIVSAFVVKALNALAKKWLAELERNKPELADALKTAVNLAVKAAEGMELGEFIDGKKQYAMEIAQAWLNQEGWDEVDIDVLEAAIEAEVLKLFNSSDGDGSPGVRLLNDNDWRAF
jgi:hypothetical protein